MAVLGKFKKTPTERRKYAIDYSEWLEEGETLSSVTLSATPVTAVPLTFTSTVNPPFTTVIFFVGGGDAYNQYKIDVVAVTSAGQTKEDTLFIDVYTP